MNRSEIKTVEWLLTHWGRWAYHQRGLSVSWSVMEPYERMAHERMGNSYTPLISEEDALAVDKAVAELCAARPQEGKATALYYLCKPTYRDLGKELGKHHSVVANWVDSGKMWVEGRLIDRVSRQIP